MLEIKVLATGSKGNCYLISDSQTSLLLEAGISFRDIQKGLNFETSNLAGILVSHEHMDHARGVPTLIKRGIDVYMSQGTREALGIKSNRIKSLKSKEQVRIGSWTILPFDTAHDVAEPLGFLLQSDYGFKVLFATDTYFVKYKFSGLTHILIECNYDMQTLEENVRKGLHPAQAKRVMRSHMSLETLLDFFKANDLSKVQEIYLLHLSDGNSNEERIRTEVARATGKMIYIP